jgi:cysteine sulfinate desulfinase/cysteine desulfurase-like protein
MGIRIEKTETPNLDSYVDAQPHTPSASELEEIFTQEDENDTTNRSSSIQSGWAAAKKAVAKSNQKYATDFRFEEDVKLIKFISGEPMTFMEKEIH